MSAKRALSPSTNPAGLMSAVAAIYAAVVMIVHVVHHQGVIDPQVIVSAVGAAAALYTRFLVTPVADPKDGNGVPLLRTYASITPPRDYGPEHQAARIAALQQYEGSAGAGKVTPPQAAPPHDPMDRP